MRRAVVRQDEKYVNVYKVQPYSERVQTMVENRTPVRAGRSGSPLQQLRRQQQQLAAASACRNRLRELRVMLLVQVHGALSGRAWYCSLSCRTV